MSGFAWIASAALAVLWLAFLKAAIGSTNPKCKIANCHRCWHGDWHEVPEPDPMSPTRTR